MHTTDCKALIKFLHGPFSCLESQWRSSQPWRGRGECRESESCGSETHQAATKTIQMNSNVYLKQSCVLSEPREPKCPSDIKLNLLCWSFSCKDESRSNWTITHNRIWLKSRGGRSVQTFYRNKRSTTTSTNKSAKCIIILKLKCENISIKVPTC